MGHVESVQQEELVGLFKFCLRLNPSAAGGEQRAAIESCMGMVTRLGLKAKYPKEVAVMTD
eukprot:15300336-Alexandrium_andersonii.AAC.1